MHFSKNNYNNKANQFALPLRKKRIRKKFFSNMPGCIKVNACIKNAIIDCGPVNSVNCNELFKTKCSVNKLL